LATSQKGKAPKMIFPLKLVVRLPVEKLSQPTGSRAPAMFF